MAFAFGIGGALRGGGDSVSPFVYASVSDLFVVIAAGYLLAVTLGMGFTGIAVALALSALTRAVPTMLKYRQGAWKAIRIYRVQEGAGRRQAGSAARPNDLRAARCK